MDLSALIFVALAVAWAVYLIPKALKHHDDVVRSRSVERFSHTMRVLARREPVNRRDARLVVTPGRRHAPPVVTAKRPVPAVDERAAERTATRRATRRRRRVLALVLLANAAVITLAATRVLDWWYVALPAGLLVAWLVACRLMVRRERAGRTPRRRPADPPTSVAESNESVAMEERDDLVNTASTPAITDPSLWDPMPVTLPTYVTKPQATRRTVRTI
ncbi:MAG: divisome protein SepX/GlpR, partial [Nocardioides sp.]